MMRRCPPWGDAHGGDVPWGDVCGSHSGGMLVTPMVESWPMMGEVHGTHHGEVTTMGDMLVVPMMRTYPWCHPHIHGELLVAPVMGGCPQWGKVMVPTMGGCPGWRKLMVMCRCPR